MFRRRHIHSLECCHYIQGFCCQLSWQFCSLGAIFILTARGIVESQAYKFSKILFFSTARRGGVEVAGRTLDQTIRVRFLAYPHHVWALWWQGGKRCLRTSRCPCRGRLGTLKTPSCPWVPGSRSKFGNWTSVPSLYSWNIAKCDVKPQSTNYQPNFFYLFFQLRLINIPNLK